ncbi:hypothetical protein GCM10009127_08330 [Alteraurantiacibacter aestuarii]|uniref:Thioredoxin n=1 Tax=Alteraurantiacibacter aestuarii TaxID=650004 RepID=A0A844ZHB0_9SPHN|nr:MJ0042-type zinc finger domain-containing protein [Alteraurantiacibacter aestuarii]MXO87225.1 thioredoxin [Alteraurantiacibacter aestuarii]
MIIECPACATRYVVPDSAIGVDGRTVRCAKCRHSWFQDGPALELAEGASTAAAPPEQEPEPRPEPKPEPAPPPPAQRAAPPPPAARAPFADETARDEGEPPLGRDDVPPPPIEQVHIPAHDDLPGSAFDAQPPFRRRRNWLKVWTWAAAIFAIFAAALIFAVSYWGLPDWVPVTRPDFAVGEPDLQLDFPIDQQEKREMPSGIEYFAINGTITNIGNVARSVPPVLVVLRDARDRKVFELEVRSPQSSLGPGESVSVTQAVTDVPRSARMAEIGWKAE